MWIWFVRFMNLFLYHSLLSFILMWFRIEWNRGRIENTIFHFISTILCFVPYSFYCATCKPIQNTKKNMLKYNFFSRAARYVDEIWSYRIPWIESWSGKKHTIKIYTTSFAILWKHSFIQYSLFYVFCINVLDIW